MRPGVRIHDVPEAGHVDLSENGLNQMPVVSVHRGSITGQLVRWVVENGGDRIVEYEARIDGLPDNAGLSEICAYDPDELWALLGVCMDLRYEWRRLLGHFGEGNVVWFPLTANNGEPEAT